MFCHWRVPFPRASDCYPCASYLTSPLKKGLIMHTWLFLCSFSLSDQRCASASISNQNKSGWIPRNWTDNISFWNWGYRKHGKKPFEGWQSDGKAERVCKQHEVSSDGPKGQKAEHLNYRNRTTFMRRNRKPCILFSRGKHG